VELHYLDQPIEVLLQRVSKRGAEFPPIQMSDLVAWAEMFDAPSDDEMSLYDPPRRTTDPEH